MIPADPSLVQATHLARGAYLYIRQSTLRQVVENTESARRQYALRERAEALGWPAERIEVIDCDQGVSGISAADRKGFRRLVSEVSMGRVGIVLGLEVSRLARNCSDWHRLVELCAMTGTLILDQDGLYDPTTFNHQIVLGIKGFMSAVEISILRARLRGGLLGKASRGELRIGLPVGFVYDETGRVCLHPDAQVRQSIHLLFETFRRTGTAGATVKCFGDKSLLFPRPAGPGSRTREVLWRPLDLPTVVRILHNPRYAGAYAYGRRHTEKRPDGGWRTTNLPREKWHTLVHDAHPGYIDWDEFERNEQQLRRSALAYGLDNRRSPPRQGPALLQGLVICGVCGSRMTVRYHQRPEGLVPDYQCITGRMQQRKPLCQVIGGASIDRAVGERLVAAMTPMAIELSLAVRAELQARIDEADRLRMQQVERARHEAHLARRRYMQIDPDNRLVATTLEADWNETLRALAQAQDEADRQRAADQATLGEATEARIRALAQDFPAVWNDASTLHRDKKRMAQLLIEDVTLLRTDRLQVHIRFKGGALETLSLPLPKNAWRKRLTHPDVVKRIEQLIEQYDEAQVAERLNIEGLRTGAGRPFDQAAVSWVCYTHGLTTTQERLRRNGKLTVRQAAALLGLPESTARSWACDGRLRAVRRGRKPLWLIDPIDEQPESIRELVAQRPQAATDPPQRREETPWSRLRQAGKLTTPEMAVRLGIGLKTAANWARAGRLRGQRFSKGLRARWIFDPIDDQPEEIRQRAVKCATVKPRGGLLSHAAAAVAGRGAV